VTGDQGPVRPRYGTLTRAADGSKVPIVFHPIEGQPGQFQALYADTEEPVVANHGDRITADVVATGQSIVYESRFIQDDGRPRRPTAVTDRVYSTRSSPPGYSWMLLAYPSA
jgi:hypothetical protein